LPRKVFDRLSLERAQLAPVLNRGARGEQHIRRLRQQLCGIPSIRERTHDCNVDASPQRRLAAASRSCRLRVGVFVVGRYIAHGSPAPKADSSTMTKVANESSLRPRR